MTNKQQTFIIPFPSFGRHKDNKRILHEEKGFINSLRLGRIIGDGQKVIIFDNKEDFTSFHEGDIIEIHFHNLEQLKRYIEECPEDLNAFRDYEPLKRIYDYPNQHQHVRDGDRCIPNCILNPKDYYLVGRKPDAIVKLHVTHNFHHRHWGGSRYDKIWEVCSFDFEIPKEYEAIIHQFLTFELNYSEKKYYPFVNIKDMLNVQLKKEGLPLLTQHDWDEEHVTIAGNFYHPIKGEEEKERLLFLQTYPQIKIRERTS